MAENPLADINIDLISQYSPERNNSGEVIGEVTMSSLPQMTIKP